MSEKLRQGKERLLGWRDSLWEKLTSKIPRLPRPWRAARNLVCIVLAVYLIWLMLGGRPLTVQWAFRRAERQDMVGPSEILGAFEAVRYSGDDYFRRFLVGETEEGLLICNISGNWYWGYTGYLDYWEKTGDITLVPVEENWGSMYPYDDNAMAYFLAVTELPGAVYAELDVTAQDEEEDEIEQWYVTAEMGNGCFVFPFENFYWRYTGALSGEWSSGVVEAAYTLRIYDSQGELLGQRSWSYAQERKAVEERARRQEGLARY